MALRIVARAVFRSGDVGVGERAGPIGGRGGLGHEEAGEVRLARLHRGELLGQIRAALR